MSPALTPFWSTSHNDPDPAVRLQAVEGLRRYTGEPAAIETLKFVLVNDADPAVRSQAIDILAPANGNASIPPAVAQAIQDVMRFPIEDEYVRDRCTQVLHEAKLTVVY